MSRIPAYKALHSVITKANSDEDRQKPLSERVAYLINETNFWMTAYGYKDLGIVVLKTRIQYALTLASNLLHDDHARISISIASPDAFLVTFRHDVPKYQYVAFEKGNRLAVGRISDSLDIEDMLFDKMKQSIIPLDQFMAAFKGTEDYLLPEEPVCEKIREIAVALMEV